MQSTEYNGPSSDTAGGVRQGRRCGGRSRVSNKRKPLGTARCPGRTRIKLLAPRTSCLKLVSKAWASSTCGTMWSAASVTRVQCESMALSTTYTFYSRVGTVSWLAVKGLAQVGKTNERQTKKIMSSRLTWVRPVGTTQPPPVARAHWSASSA